MTPLFPSQTYTQLIHSMDPLDPPSKYTQNLIHSYQCQWNHHDLSLLIHLSLHQSVCFYTYPHLPPMLTQHPEGCAKICQIRIPLCTEATTGNWKHNYGTIPFSDLWSYLVLPQPCSRHNGVHLVPRKHQYGIQIIRVLMLAVFSKWNTIFPRYLFDEFPHILQLFAQSSAHIVTHFLYPHSLLPSRPNSLFLHSAVMFALCFQKLTLFLSSLLDHKLHKSRSLS